MKAEVWVPAENPNPSAILRSAVNDTRKGRYEQALSKFLWFHNNALQHEVALTGVRLSFAFAYWLELAATYPPAREAFVRIRDETEDAFRKAPTSFELFQDVAAMNRRLGDGIRTAVLFETVAETDHAKAQRLYRLAESDLIAAGRIQACAPFLDPDRRLKLAAECYRVSREHEESRRERNSTLPKLARKFYIDDVASLVGLLVLNDRRNKAQAAYDHALTIVNDVECRSILDAAMCGHLPNRSI